MMEYDERIFEKRKSKIENDLKTIHEMFSFLYDIYNKTYDYATTSNL